MLGRWADYLERRGRWADVLASQQTALAAARRHGDPVMQAIAHQGLGLNYSHVDRQGRHQEALEHNRLALAAAEAAGDLIGQVGCLNSVGWQLAQLGDYHRSIAYCERALTVPVEHDRRFHADAWDTLGFAHQRLWEQEQAVECFERAAALHHKLRILEDLGHPDAERLRKQLE